jgi:hypothetical protein
MMTSLATKFAPLNVTDIVRQTMEEVSGNKDDALRLLTLRRNDPAVNEAFRVLGIKQAIRQLQTGERHTAEFFSERPVRTVNEKEVAARAALRAADKLFWDAHTLFGGRVVLRDAVRADLRESADQFGKMEKGNRNMRLFHSALANGLPNDVKTVSDFYAAAKVVEIAQRYEVIP